MPSYQYRKSHCEDKTVVRSSYLHNGFSYTGKMASLYLNRGPDSYPRLDNVHGMLFHLSQRPPPNMATTYHTKLCEQFSLTQWSLEIVAVVWEIHFVYILYHDHFSVRWVDVKFRRMSLTITESNGLIHAAPSYCLTYAQHISHTRYINPLSNNKCLSNPETPITVTIKPWRPTAWTVKCFLCSMYICNIFWKPSQHYATTAGEKWYKYVYIFCCKQLQYITSYGYSIKPCWYDWYTWQSLQVDLPVAMW